MNYEQHNETFNHEMERLKESLPDPEIACLPMFHIHEMWNQMSMIMKELDELDDRGTNIPSLTIAAIRLRAMIFIIPENLNLENRAKEAQHDHYDA
tara:strand:- start:888 stop:1175 length:288 start_codon:yes stop_codon:yes gene_type:complete